MPRTPLIPCHLIGGPLGVGKTTAIRHHVARSPEFTAVLVNDFGETAYDAGLLAAGRGSERLRVEDISGGCVCCTSAAKVLPALQTLCADPRVQRVIIEPSGVALLDPLLHLLRQAAPICGLELAPVIVLLDPVSMQPASLGLVTCWSNLVARARIAVINRCDLAAEKDVAAMQRSLEASSPPKLAIVQTRFGELPQALFDLREDPVEPVPGPLPHAALPQAGFFRSPALFRRKALVQVIEAHVGTLERFKGVFRTDAGGCRLEIARGRLFQSSVPAPSISTADWIGCDDQMTPHLQACQTTPGSAPK